MADLFSQLKDITQNKKQYKDLTEDEVKQVNPYMLNRFLSMNKDFIELVNFIQWIPYENKKSYWNIYLDVLPKKSLWLNYIKSKTKEPNKDLLNIISKYFECSSKETKSHLKFLSKADLKEILTSLGYEDKDITKILK
jgi:hypothetical protein